MEIKKEQQKTYTPSPNAKDIILDIGKSNKKLVEDIIASTGKSPNCVVATANAKNNKTLMTYHSKCKVQINGELVEQKAYIELTELGKKYLVEWTTKNANNN